MTPVTQKQQEEKNKQIVRQFFELLDLHDTDRMEQLLISTNNYTFQSSGRPVMDWNGHKQLLAAITGAFSDLNHDIKDIVAEGDKVAVRLSVSGTHKSEFQGIAATGRKLSLDEMAFLTIIDGRITQGWITSDTMSFMQQIGAIHATAADAHAPASSKGNNNS